jgi:hypothetical protein
MTAATNGQTRGDGQVTVLERHTDGHMWYEEDGE